MEETPKVVRSLRHIIGAEVAHVYVANYYVETSDGAFAFTHSRELKISETNVRLRQAGTSAWEEKVPNCPGWFRCDPPPFKAPSVKLG